MRSRRSRQTNVFLVSVLRIKQLCRYCYRMRYVMFFLPHFMCVDSLGNDVIVMTSFQKHTLNNIENIALSVIFIQTSPFLALSYHIHTQYTQTLDRLRMNCFYNCLPLLLVAASSFTLVFVEQSFFNAERKRLTTSKMKCG